MLPLLVPVFAQVVTLGVHDRTEARYLVSYRRRYEGSTQPGAALRLAWPRYQLSLAYNPSFLLTPLEKKPRELLVFHNLALGASYNGRHTSVALSSSLSFGQVNFQLAALQNPAGGAVTPVGGTPTPNQTGQPAQPTQSGGTTPGGTQATPGGTQTVQTRVVDRSVSYGISNSNLQISHKLGRNLTLSGFVSYLVGGGLTTTARRDYPTTRGTTLGLTGAHMFNWSARDGFASGVSAMQSLSSNNGNRVTAVLASEAWNHKVDLHLSTTLGAGLSFTRFSQDQPPVAWSVFPNFTAGLAYQRSLARGAFNFAGTAYSAPALDPLRATIDPRVGFGGNLGWGRKRFSTAVSATAAVSTAGGGNNAGAFDSYQGSFSMAYKATKWLTLDTGGRFVHQLFQGVTIVPWSYTVFVGLTLGYDIPIARFR